MGFYFELKPFTLSYEFEAVHTSRFYIFNLKTLTLKPLTLTALSEFL